MTMTKCFFFSLVVMVLFLVAQTKTSKQANKGFKFYLKKLKKNHFPFTILFTSFLKIKKYLICVNLFVCLFVC